MLLRTSAVQTYLTGKMASYLSKELNTEISVGAVDISWFLNIVIKDVKVKDRSGQNILNVKALEADIGKISFTKHHVDIDKIYISDADINMCMYKGDSVFNYAFIIDYFSSDKSDTSVSIPWSVSLNALSLTSVSFAHINYNAIDMPHGINFNKLKISNINGDIDAIRLKGDSINAHVKKLSLAEQSGFVLNELSGICTLTSESLIIEHLKLLTPQSDISLSLLFNYAGLRDFNNFVEDVKMDIQFNRSFINLDDVAYFAPALYGMNNIIDIDGHIKGPVANLKGRDIVLRTGKHTQYKGNFNITGLPNIDDSYINISAKELTTNLADINKFTLPGDAGGRSLQLPAELTKLGYLTFKGNFSGFTTDFVAYGDFNTAIGSMRTDLSVKSSGPLLSYSGRVALNNFDMGKMFDNKKNLGKVSLDFKLNGSGTTLETVNMDMSGNIRDIVLKNYSYHNISLAGNLSDKTFTGYVAVKDENIDMDFEGKIDMRNEKLLFDFSSYINYAKLNKLNVTDKDIEREVSTFMKCRFRGQDIEDISGTFLFNNLTYKEDEKSIKIESLQINNTSDSNHYKNIVINSELLDLNVEGEFTYADLPASFTAVVNKYLPSYTLDTLYVKDTAISTNLRYDLKVKSAAQLTQFLPGEMKISDDLNLYGNFSFKNDYMSLAGGASTISFGDVLINNWYVNASPENATFNIQTGCENMYPSEGINIENLNLDAGCKHDSILFDLKWYNEIAKNSNRGDFKGYASFENLPEIRLSLQQGKLNVNDTVWTLAKTNQILFDSSRIKVKDFVMTHNLQTVGIDGEISADSSHSLNVFFKNFDIAEFNPILSKQKLEVDGNLSGNVILFNLFSSPNFLADVKINDLNINGDKLGNLTLNSTWDKVEQRLLIFSEIIYVGSVGQKIPFKTNGFYYPYAEDNNLDLKINFDNFSLKMIENYLSSFSSDLRGLAYGELTLKGTPAAPLINGTLNLRRAGIKIDYLNTTLNFSDDIIIRNNIIIFDSLVLNDSKNASTGVLNGSLTHKNFKNINLDFTLKMNNLMCLNTNASQNELFYGTAFASGICKIYGPIEDVVIDVYAKTERNTKFFLPLESSGEVSEYPFIHFVVTDSLMQDSSVQQTTELSGLTLKFDLEVTSDAEVQIIFDSKVGDIIKANGNGNLKMDINSAGDFKMFGDYVIEQGDYLFTLQNIINKRFKIDKGSSITWSGDPYMANADVYATYNLRTPLYDLVFYTDSSEEYKKRMPVNCLLGMKGNLFNPEISFDIELPGADEKTKNLLKTIINSEAEKNRQMFALLALNRFLPPPNQNENQNIGIGSGLEATSSELLSNQLSNWLSQISNDFDIGVNYRTGNELSSDEVEVALSTQLFNDRVSIDGSVGTNGNNQNTSQIVGDVNVELKLTDEGQFRMKFYNKSNAVDMLRTNAPYTQGIGIFYKKEFDSFRELFGKKTK